MDREKRFHIADERVEEYIRDSLEPISGLLGDIRSEGIEEGVPVIAVETARLLEILVKVRKPERVLEIGTAVGFTAILMAVGIAAEGMIDTIEIDSCMMEKARANFKKAGCSGKINLIGGDAADVLANIDKTYDFIFIDAAKGQYNRYYKLCSGMVTPGGIIFADNVLYRGMVAGGAKINRRQQLLVRRLRKYIDTAVNDERFTTDLLSIGDGVCISYRKEGQE
jgi:predicted O-methyltransferase YrrM